MVGAPKGIGAPPVTELAPVATATTMFTPLLAAARGWISGPEPGLPTGPYASHTTARSPFGMGSGIAPTPKPVETAEGVLQVPA